ncbi:MAG: DUF1963 domain-containing protein [Candidatus Eremiobacteraeota bacterium]|nr:DUF1963 domain-containing protein [Candidatus Eremiobacteraeota bacterium]MCW5870291.1 DUF1963 domain-containing protein [Candidatus Eremiobacteraeota bacterium]
MVLSHLRNQPPDSSLAVLYHLEGEELREFIPLLQRHLALPGDHRSKSLLFLGRLGVVEAAAYLRDPDPHVRSQAVRLASPEQAEQVAELLSDPDQYPRHTAAERLLEWDLSAYAEPLSALSDDDNSGLRRALKAAFKRWNYKPPKKAKLTVEQQLRQLGEKGAALWEAALPSLRAQVSKGPPAPGASRLGGRPDLPEDQKWPSGMSFAAQFQVTGLEGFDGWLLFFVDPDLEEGCVLQIPAHTELKPRATPAGIQEFPSLALKLKKELSLPGLYSELAFQLERPTRKLYQRILEDAGQGPGDIQHRLLGNAAWVQGTYCRATSRPICSPKSIPSPSTASSGAIRVGSFSWPPATPP